MNNLRTYIGAWGRWLLVVVLLVIKCYVFDVLVQQPEAVSYGLLEILTKSAAAALLALPVVLTSRRYPVFIVLVVADIWMIVNILYFRAYRLFITWHLFSLATNLSGFESSIGPYLSPSLLLFPLLTLPALACFAWPAQRLGWKSIVSIVLIALLLSLGGSYKRWNKYRPYLNGEGFTWEWINPCGLPRALSADISENERQAGKYIYQHSILAYPLFMIHDALHSPAWTKQSVTLTEEEQAELAKLLQPEVPANEPAGHLVMVLLESFESWLLDATDAEGRPVCPALNDYIHTRPVLYVKDVATQIQYGMSGDGQLIVNTGLYPTLEGVACVDYAYNTYPNLAHFYPHSAIVNPCRNVWNQTVIAAAYGYRQLIEPETENRFEWNDSVVVDKMIESLTLIPSPCCMMAITVSGHIPFDSSPDDICIPDTVPELFRRYMQTAHFTDRQMGRLLAWADTAAVMQNSTIVITGDHRIFHAWLNDETRDFGLRAHLPFGTGQAGCPLIIKTPQITSTQVIDRGKQVDIYPIILDFIGQKSYFWKGVGHNLLEESSSSEEEYLLRRQLSDKLIRMNYFAQ